MEMERERVERTGLLPNPVPVGSQTLGVLARSKGTLCGVQTWRLVVVGFEADEEAISDNSSGTPRRPTPLPPSLSAAFIPSRTRQTLRSFRTSGRTRDRNFFFFLVLQNYNSSRIEHGKDSWGTAAREGPLATVPTATLLPDSVRGRNDETNAKPSS